MSRAVSRYAVLGNPVEHSQSPFIHAAYASQTGEPVLYERMLCPMDGFADAVRAFAAAGASGCNVTMPFKFDAFDLATRKTSRALLAGACNTLTFTGGDWIGDNTDGAGLVRDIERNAGIALAGARVLVVGAGGGAAGALGALALAGAAEIVIANRNRERAERLVARFCDSVGGVAHAPVRARGLDDCGTRFDIVVNASASSATGAPVPVAASVLKPGALAVDMMYGPLARGFVSWATEHGAVGRDGLGMLVEQAAEAFLFWRGVEPETATVLAALRRRLEPA
jgi:shikimate dehydrogenase